MNLAQLIDVTKHLFMSTIIHSHERNPPIVNRLRFQRATPIAAMVFMHVTAFYALQSELLPQISHASQHEVSVSIITPEAPLGPLEPPIKTVPVKTAQIKAAPVVKQVAIVPHVEPALNNTPSPESIVVSSAKPMPAERSIAVGAAASQALAASVPSVPVVPVQPKTISSGVEYIRAPEPEYPLISRRMHEEGKTLLRVLVDETGHPERAEIKKSSGSVRLDEAAQQAVLAVLFKPYVEDGRAIPVFALVPINFHLDN
jgi:protein TonB